ncbi:MAG TPA: ABC transporter ATP-binding protein [Thermomicrobiales bacterium]|nr:ABC transporter ATP-binding protein [Thermomicrobiales bacterium]
MTLPNATYLTLDHLTKRYGAVGAVDDVSLNVAEGEFVSLLGPSGCGKTTTLRMIAGFVVPTAGRIVLSGREIADVPPYRRGMGVVFQNYALFPHLNVAQNVAFGLQMARVPKAEAQRRVERALALVRLEGYGRRRIRELSGGQQQRVALARALVIEPTVLLLDEPLSNLDAKLREELRQEIRDIQQELGITTLFVTHDQVEALTMSDRIVVLNRGQIEQVGTPEEVYERPASRFVADFIGRANFLEGEVVASDGAESQVAFGDAGSVVVAKPLPPAQKVTLMVRPHRMRMSPPGGEGGILGSVEGVTYLGDLIQYQISAGGERLMVEQGSRGEQGRRFPVGETVRVSWDPGAALIFDRA